MPMNTIPECFTRPAVAADTKSVLRVMDSARAYQRSCGNMQWADDYPSRAIIEADIAGGCAYVWVADGAVNGFAVVRVRDRGYAGVAIPGPAPWPNWCVVHRLALSDACRGRGMGRRFLLDILDRVCAQGIEEVRIDTGGANTGMRHLAEKCGFRQLGEAVFAWGPRLVYSFVRGHT